MKSPYTGSPWISSHQPTFLPWIGFWNKLARADRFVFNAGCNFARGDYHNRTRLGGGWLTLPVENSRRTMRLHEARLATDAGKVTGALKRAFDPAKEGLPYRHRLEPIFRYLTTVRAGDRLIDVNFNLICIVSDALGVVTPMNCDMDVEGDTTTKRIWNRIRPVCSGEFTYLLGPSGVDYFEPGEFPAPVLIQELRPGLDPSTILQLIAKEDDPLASVLHAAQWVPFSQGGKDD